MIETGEKNEENFNVTLTLVNFYFKINVEIFDDKIIEA